MDNLPNEIHGMIASHLPTKDLRSYRLVNRRYESVANRILFDTVLFVLEKNLKGSFTIRPAIAQFIKRVHIDTRKVIKHVKPTSNKPGKVKRLIENLVSAGANITELCMQVEEEVEDADPKSHSLIAKAEAEDDDFDPDTLGNTAAKHAEVLVECSSILSTVTHFGFCTSDWGESDDTTQAALSSLIKFLESLKNLGHVCLDVDFRDDLNKDDLDRLWTIFLDRFDNCPEQLEWRGVTSIHGGCCSCEMYNRSWSYFFKDQYEVVPFTQGRGPRSEGWTDEDQDQDQSDSESELDGNGSNDPSHEVGSDTAENSEQSEGDDDEDDSYVHEDDDVLDCVPKTL